MTSYREFWALLVLAILSAGSPLDPADLPGDEAYKQDRSTDNHVSSQDDFKITVNVESVVVDVIAVGKGISELKAQDFIVYDNGVSQVINNFSRDLRPLALALLVDCSGSLTGYGTPLKLGTLLALRHLKPDDQVALFSFANEWVKLNDLTQDRVRIADITGTLKPKVGAGTNLYYAVRRTADYLRKNAPNSRRVIVLVSDNCDTWAKFYDKEFRADDLLMELTEGSVTLYSIRVGEESCIDTEGIVKLLVEESGGEQLHVNDSLSLNTALSTALYDLRSQFVLGFTPSNPGKRGSFHKLMVKLATRSRCPGCRIRARRGYYAGILPPAPPPDTRSAGLDAAEGTDQSLIQRIISTAGTTLDEFFDIPFAVKTASIVDSNGKPQAKVDLEIDAASVGFKTIDDRHECKLHVTIFYIDSKRRIIGSDWRIIEGLLSRKTYDQIMKTGIPFSMTIPPKTGKLMLKIVVFDEQTGILGSRRVKIQ